MLFDFLVCAVSSAKKNPQRDPFLCLLPVYNFSKEPEKRKVRRNAALLKHGVCLGDFVASQTAGLFSILETSSFMSIPPSQWNDVEAYQKPKCRVVYSSCIVNDTAERGVKEFNTLLTKDEDEKQFLLQVVEVNSKAVPTEATKKDVIDAL